MSIVKRAKIINDPVHGFIEIPRGILLDLIDTSAFQRLRRIKQLGQSGMVYPGAVHTRFNHALGAMFLTRQALDVLRRKKVEISKKEYKGALVAILLHDVGHGPFSHALEHAIIPGLHHEDMSVALMHYLNRKFKGKLDTAIEIFTGQYEKTFLHQLVSSQLDMDRMDYLIRDSFFTGVAEGVVGIDRIIKVLNVVDGKLVYEDKGIYSIEKFIVARRLMYWQVYLHKAALASELMMVRILSRARALVEAGKPLFLDDSLGYFFRQAIDPKDLNEEVIERYLQLDDDDIEFHLKKWQQAADPVLSDLCQRLLSRHLLKIRLRNEPVSETELDEVRAELQKRAKLSPEAVPYYVFAGQVSNRAYLENSQEPILICYKDDSLVELSEASDIQNIHAMSAEVTKYYLCVPG